MGDEEAVVGGELLLPAVAGPARGRGRALQSALRAAVREGRLAPGVRLPSSRALAADLGVSRGVVTEAYEQLTAEGYLRSGHGSGTWVSGAARDAARPPVRDKAPRREAGWADFTPGLPDLSLFPRASWAAAQRAAVSGTAHAALGYPDPRGVPRLRTELAGLLARRRGVAADPERLVVCAGVSQALALVCAELRARGERVIAVENPGSPGHGTLFETAGVGTVGIPVDSEGIDVGALRRSGARTVVVTPAHQFPVGCAYSPGRRAELLDWAREVDGLVLEDDYDGDFRYDRAPVGALQGLDPERVLYCGSVSKSLAPGLRLGWFLAPARYAGALADRKRTTDLGAPVLEQETFAYFLERGAYDRQLRRCRQVYRQRRDVLVAALDRRLPQARVTGIAAGLHALVQLPPGCGDAAATVDRAARLGVTVVPLSAYGTIGTAAGRARGDEGGVLVIGYAHVSESRIEEGIRRLAQACGP